MQNKHRFLFFSLVGLLVALLLSAAGRPFSGDGLSRTRLDEPQHDHRFMGSEQISPCMAILLEAANKAGVKGTIGNTDDQVFDIGSIDCNVVFSVNDPYATTTTALGLSGNLPTTDDQCDNLAKPEGDQYQSTTFHGYNAMIYDWKTASLGDEPVTTEIKHIDWCMHKGGRIYFLAISTTSNPIEKYGPAQDPLPIAEVLWSIAEDRLPLSEAPVDGAEQPSSVPVEPGEVVPGQPEAPTDETVPTDTGELFGIPLAVILGSLGIPVAGAIAGAVLSAIISDLSSAGISSVDMTKAGASLGFGSDKLANTIYLKTVFYNKFDEIIKQKLAEKYYIKNPDFATTPEPEWGSGVKEGLDKTSAYIEGREDKGGRCGEATVWGKQWLGQIAKDTFGQDTYLGKIGVTREGIVESRDVNHQSFRLILPEGERIVPDVHESLIARKAVLYNEKDWVEKYVKIIKGETIVERSDEENHLIQLIKEYGPDKAIKSLKTKKDYKDNVPLYDLLIKSYLKQPCNDPVIPPKPTVTDLRGLDG